MKGHLSFPANILATALVGVMLAASTLASRHSVAEDASTPVAPAHWTVAPTSPLPDELGDAVATFLADGRVLVVTGANVLTFDPTKRTWAKIGSLDRPRWSNGSVVLADGRILLIGGEGRAPEGGTKRICGSGSNPLAAGNLAGRTISCTPNFWPVSLSRVMFFFMVRPYRKRSEISGQQSTGKIEIFMGVPEKI